MKITKGYIALNQTTWGDGFEFFGIYTSRKEAEARLRQIIKQRFASRKELQRAEEEDGDSYKVVYFNSEQY